MIRRIPTDSKAAILAGAVDYSDEMSQEEITQKNEKFRKLFGADMPDSLLSPHKLSAEISVPESHGCMYPVSDEIRTSLLYPIVLCRNLSGPTHYTKRSDWPVYQLIYTHSGQGALHLDDHHYPLRPGSFCLLDCRAYHYFYADSPGGWDYSFIHFDGPSAKLLFDYTREKGVVWENMRETKVRNLYRSLFDLNEYDGDDFYLLFHRLLTDLLYELGQTQAQSPMGHRQLPVWIGNTQTYILDHYNETLTVGQLAQTAHLSDSYFAHLFKEYIGMSPIDYQYSVRINHAKEYLILTDLTIETICEMVGFHNTANFYAMFKKEAGESPARFRKKNRSLSYTDSYMADIRKIISA